MSGNGLSDQVLAEARLWLGTPYHHQASRRGLGCDCLGLIRGIWRAVYGAEPEVLGPYSPDWGDFEGGEALAAALNARLIPLPIAMMQPGDVALFRIYELGPAKHLGVISALGEAPRFIHAYSRHGVIENALSRPWLRRISMIYRFSERS